MPQAVRIVAHRNKSGKTSIRLRCLIMGKYADIATGVSLLPHEWDSCRLRVLPTHPDHKAINALIDDLSDRAAAFLTSHPDTDAAQLRASLATITPRMDTTPTDDLFDALRSFIATESRRNTWADSTVRRIQSLASALSTFSPVLHLSTLSASTLDKYIDFRASRGYNNTTIGREIRLIRWFLRWCAANDLYTGNLHETYHPHIKGANFEHKEVIYLTLEELRIIEAAPLPSYLAGVRDVFVFCCYTGLRFSDASTLHRSDIHEHYIEVVTRKTGKRIRIDLNKHSAAILDRYKDSDYPDGRALPVLSNQYTNDLLKTIGELCDISAPVHLVKYSGNRRLEQTVPKYTLLSTHCARRTFVVTALQLGIPLEVISRWTGHHDLKALRPYVAIVDELKAANMAKFDTL